MRTQSAKLMLGGLAALVIAPTFGLSEGLASDWNHIPKMSLPVHFSGLMDDHTPSAAVVSGGPYEMHGRWSLEVDERRGTARFTAAMDMETSDYGIIQGTVNKDDPRTRGQHTHHITMTDGVLTPDWPARCPSHPAFTEGLAIMGTMFVTGNGAPAPFGNPSPVTICLLGGTTVKYATFTMAIGTPASKHFGTQPIYGVVQKCSGWSLRPSRDCTVQQ